MFNKFQGIRPLVEGLVDADYVNCVPTGATIVDRTCYIDDGEFPTLTASQKYDREKPVWTPPVGSLGWKERVYYDLDGFSWDGSRTFTKENVDFQYAFTFDNRLYRIYLSNSRGIYDSTNGKTQYIFLVITDLTTGEHRLTCTPIIATWITLERYIHDVKWSHAISSTKPNQIYFTFDTKNIYWIDVRLVDKFFNSVANPCPIKCMTSSCINPNNLSLIVGTQSGQIQYAGNALMFVNWDCLDKSSVFEIPIEYELRQNPSRNFRISWYDNRLVCVDTITGVVNLTATDPARFYRDIATTDVTTNTWGSYGVNNVWTSWYASTLSSDSIVDVIPAFGYLFFINNMSIECWTRSGNEAAPLNPVSNYVSNIKVKVVNSVGNFLIAVAEENGKLGVYTIQPNAYSKISNTAVDKFVEGVKSIGVISQNGESHIGLFKDGMTIVFDPIRSIWYRLTDAPTTQPEIFVDETRCVSTRGSIILPTRRMLDYGEYYQIAGKTSFVERAVVDNLVEFTKRKSLVQLDILGDMGSVELDAPASYTHTQLNDNVSVSLEVSTTHGKKWSTQFFRKAPHIGKYDAKVTYNGLGSGESFLMRLKWWTQNHYTLIGFDLKAT